METDIKPDYGMLDNDLDVSRSGQQIWFVRVPMDMMNRWQNKPDGSQLGTCTLTQELNNAIQVSDHCKNED